jgi:O-antigen ligase
MREAHADGSAEALGSALASLLVVGTLLFYLITLSPFIDLTAAASADPAADRTSALNQIVFLALTGGLWLAAARSPARTLVAGPRGLILALVLWCAAASAISAHPDIALRRVVLATLTVTNAGIVLILPRSERHFAGLLGLGCLATLLVAYLGVFLLPRLAIHQATEIREPMNAGLWRGHFAHKNAAAGAMVLLAFIGLHLRSAGRRLEGLAIVVLAAIFLQQTGGKTASAALPGILGLAWVFERRPALRAPIVLGGVAAFNALTIGCAISADMRAAVAALGIDPTFTNRIDIWRIGVAAIAERPLTGYGFQLFWQTDELVYSTGGGASWAVAAFNGHNAYLDAAVTTGLPGLALTLLWLLWLPLKDVGRADAAGNDPALTRLFTRIWLYGVFSACVESLFFQSGSLVWFFMLIAVFGLRLQGRATLVAGADAPRPAGGPVHA